MCVVCEREGVVANYQPKMIDIKSKEGYQYLLVGLYNMDDNEKCSLIKLISCLKSLHNLLEINDVNSKRDLMTAIYHRVQRISLEDILYWLHHADKKGSKEGEILVSYFLQIRILLTDWVNNKVIQPENDYQLRSKDRGKIKYNIPFKMIKPRSGSVLLFIFRLFYQNII